PRRPSRPRASAYAGAQEPELECRTILNSRGNRGSERCRRGNQARQRGTGPRRADLLTKQLPPSGASWRAPCPGWVRRPISSPVNDAPSPPSTAGAPKLGVPTVIKGPSGRYGVAAGHAVAAVCVLAPRAALIQPERVPPYGVPTSVPVSGRLTAAALV